MKANIASQKAGLELNLAGERQQFREGVRQFQESLRQQAFVNRLALTGGPSAPVAAPIGAGLAGVTGASANLNQLIAQLGKGRSTTQTTSGGGLAGLQTAGSLIGGAALAASSLNAIFGGGAAAAAGVTAAEIAAITAANAAVAGAAGAGTVGLIAAGGTAAAASSARFKKSIVPYDRDEYDVALDKLRATPITTWRYRWEEDGGRKHVGPILELSPDDIKASDTHIDLLSYSGLIHAGLRAVDRKVNRLSAALAETERPRRRLAVA